MKLKWKNEASPLSVTYTDHTPETHYSAPFEVMD